MKHNCDVGPHIVNDLSLQPFGGSFIRTSIGDSLKVLEGTNNPEAQIQIKFGGNQIYNICKQPFQMVCRHFFLV